MLLTQEQVKQAIDRVELYGILHQEVADELGVSVSTWKRYRNRFINGDFRVTHFDRLNSIRNEIEGKSASAIAKMYKDKFGLPITAGVLYPNLRRMKIKWKRYQTHSVHKKIPSDVVIEICQKIESGKYTTIRAITRDYDLTDSTVSRNKQIRSALQAHVKRFMK